MNILINSFFWLFIIFILFNKFIFLRDNNNCIPDGENIVSPASGKIVYIKKISSSNNLLEIKKGFFGMIKTNIPYDEDYYLVNIFMNVYNVHFTKMPYKGEIVEIIKRPGKFRGVFTLERAIENEKQEFIIESKLGFYKVIQIAGFLARRCVSFVSKGDFLDKGAKLGQILLGSQVALLIPSKVLTPKVKVGDKVSAGESILFSIKN